MAETSDLIEKGECPDCGSSDACAVYDDGHTHCFSCGVTNQAKTKGKRVTESKKKVAGLLPEGQIKYLSSRGLNRETCEKFRYSIGEMKGEAVQIAPYYDLNGRMVAQKIRTADKKFLFLGDAKDATLFGQQLWRNTGGKRLVITEGEIDAMSVAQAFGLGWPVVSVPTGAKGAAKAVAQNLGFVESYDEVVIFFDNDEPGREAAIEVAEMLSPGKAKIASVSDAKDANELLQQKRVKDISKAIFEAKVHRPDGIINGADLWDEIDKDVAMGTPLPWTGLNAMYYGLRGGEIVTIGAGSGMGKSAIVAEIAHHLLVERKATVGYIALEEGVRRTGQRMVGLHLNKPIHLPGQVVSAKDKRAAFEATLGTGRFYTYDHFGSLDSDYLLTKLRYLVKACGVQWIIFDHISIMVSGGGAEADERKDIDRAMTNFRSFVEETGVGMILVSHLSRPKGAAHEEGGKPSLNQFRGSHGIIQLSDAVWGAQRNGQAVDLTERNTTIIWGLKNRYGGETGPATALFYDKTTGRLSEVDFEMGDDGMPIFGGSGAGFKDETLPPGKKTKGKGESKRPDADEIPF